MKNLVISALIAAFTMVATSAHTAATTDPDKFISMPEWTAAPGYEDSVAILEMKNENFDGIKTVIWFSQKWTAMPSASSGNIEFQCNETGTFCITMRCISGDTVLLFTDPSYSARIIRLWKIDYERNIKMPLDIVKPKFYSAMSEVAGMPVVGLSLTQGQIGQMANGNTVQFAYSLPTAEAGPSSVVYVHELVQPAQTKSADF